MRQVLESQFLPDEAATIAAAQALAPHLGVGDVLLLSGPLGAGKSTFARSLIRTLPAVDGTLRLEETVPSPSYTLVQTYERALGPVGHFDLYRLSTPEEVWDLGFEDFLEQGLAVIEWAERLGPLTPPRALTLTFSDQGTGRYLCVRDTRIGSLNS